MRVVRLSVILHPQPRLSSGTQQCRLFSQSRLECVQLKGAQTSCHTISGPRSLNERAPLASGLHARVRLLPACVIMSAPSLSYAMYGFGAWLPGGCLRPRTENNTLTRPRTYADMNVPSLSRAYPHRLGILTDSEIARITAGLVLCICWPGLRPSRPARRS